MPIIYTYPVKSTANDNDLILISDSQDSNKTKQIKIGDLPGGSGSGVSSVTATLPVVSSGGNTPVISLKDLTGFGTAGQVIKVNSGADGLEWGAAGGSTSPASPTNSVQFNNAGAFGGSANLTFTTNTLTVEHTAVIKGQGTGNPSGKLKLNCEENTHALTLEGPAHSGGADYTLKFPSAAPGNTQILQSNNAGQLSWIATPTGSGGGVSQVTAGGVIPVSSGAPLLVTPNTGNVVVTSARYTGGSNEGHVPLGGSATTFLRGDGTWVTPTNSTNITLTTTGTSGASTWDGTTLNIPQYSGGGISFSGTTANGIATYSNSTTATVSSVFTVSGNKLSAPAGTLADPSIEVGAVGGLYAASGGITLAHNGANAIGVSTSSIVNYKLTQFQAGLKFGSTGETLNSYEEGTWLPTSANANTISSVSGDYTRIGDMVFAQFSFTMTGATTVAIAGLPFQGVYTSALKGGVIISADSCTSVQGQLKGGQFTGTNSFTFNSYFGSGGGLPTQLRQVTASMYQTSGGTYAGVIIYETTE